MVAPASMLSPVYLTQGMHAPTHTHKHTAEQREHEDTVNQVKLRHTDSPLKPSEDLGKTLLKSHFYQSVMSTELNTATHVYSCSLCN